MFLFINALASAASWEMEKAVSVGDLSTIRQLHEAGESLSGALLVDATLGEWQRHSRHRVPWEVFDRRQAEVVRYLLSEGVPFGDEEVQSALVNAASWNLPELTVTLLEAGADPSRSRKEGHTPLCFVGGVEAAAVLLTAGSSLEGLHSPMSHYLAPQELPILEVLLNAGASTERELLLHRAIEHDNPEAVRLFLSHGASVSLANGDGHTPLQVAVLSGSEAAVAALIAAGSALEHTNNAGQTALLLAAKRRVEVSMTHGHFSSLSFRFGPEGAAIIALLLEAGADPHQTDPDGLTARLRLEALQSLEPEAGEPAALAEALALLP